VEGAELDRLIMKPTARRRLGKYVLLGRLGAGGMGKIYLAHAPGPAGIDKLLVVKRLHSHLTNDQVLVNSFLDEARLSMALNHPNIVHTYDVGDVDGRYFMVMEYIEGQNLGVVLRAAKRSGQYPKSQTWAGLFLGVLDGLHAAHTARDARGRPLQIIHRDVSPQNILITYEGLPKLVDFGIAKAAMRVSETDAGTLKGKYAYMSPEQVRGDDLDARSDVFAAGIVLWECLAGRRLYKAETIVRSVERILNEPLISPVRINPACDPGLASVALKALQKRREDRFASAEAFKEALQDALDAAGIRYRMSEGKELMHRLFADVIQTQRAVLEATLNRTDEAVEDDDDDPRKSGDSQSDLRMPQLGIRPHHESTTPSAARRSPLVTAEGDFLSPPSPAPRTTRAPSPATVSTGPQPPSPPSPSPPLLLAPPRDDEVPTRDFRPPTRSVLAGPDEATTTGVPSPASSPPPRRPLWVPVLAALLGAGLVVGVWGMARSREHVVAIAPPPPSLPPPSPPVAPPPPPVEVSPSVEAPVAVPAPVEAPPVVTEPVPPPPPTIVGNRPVRRPPPRRPTPAPAVEIKPEPKPAEASEEQGFLTLDTVPWTTVFLGKRKLGETPLVRVPVPAGTLELTLVNTEAGVREGYVARVKPGEVTRTRLDLR
jgi:eukaryotic-like serine/threonine-protein kinase